MAPPRNRRPGFSRRAQVGVFLGYVALIGGALIGATLYMLSTFNPQAFSTLRRTVAEVTTPVSTGLDWVRRGIGGIPEGIGSYLGVRSENRHLKAQIENERAQVIRAQTLERENKRLRALLKLREGATDTVVVARLVNSSISSTRRYATLNAGSWQHVEKGQPVLEAAGLIGQVLETGPNTARVLLITDAESVIPVQRVSDGMPAIATGRGDGTLDIRSANVSQLIFRNGDAFVTSGTGGVFPPNIPVGHVRHAGRDFAIAQPDANPDTPDFVTVLRLFLPEPAPAPTPTPTPTGRKAKK